MNGVSVVNEYSMLSGQNGVTYKINRTLKETASNFVYIGFLLWEVREYKYYLHDGFKSVVDYAQKELGFSKQTTYNFISVCENFSRKDQNGRPTMHLHMKYDSFSYSQLAEMLALSPARRNEIKSDMTVKQIREVKKEIVQTSGLENEIILEKLKLVDVTPKNIEEINVVEIFKPVTAPVSVDVAKVLKQEMYKDRISETLHEYRFNLGVKEGIRIAIEILEKHGIIKDC